jgi:hypothetical protein
LANSKIEQAMKRQGYDAAAITTAIERATVPIPQGEIIPPVYQEIPEEDYFAEQSGATEDDNIIEDELTEEDRRYLRLKWGKTYKPEEWVKLE